METLLLDHASHHLVLSANPDGRIAPSVVWPSAQAVLDLPLFPTGEGYAVSAWRLVSEFCSYGVAAFEESARRTALWRVMKNNPAPHLATWIRNSLQEGRVVRLAAAQDRREIPRNVAQVVEEDTLSVTCHHCGEVYTFSADCVPEEGYESQCSNCFGLFRVPGKREKGGGTAKGMLEATLTYWLEALRPDEHLGRGASRVATGVALVTPVKRAQGSLPWMLGKDQFAGYDEETGDDGKPSKSWLYLNDDHWLVKMCAAQLTNPEPIAWLLLAAYAFINELLQPVTNEHEQAFQIQVWEALAAGELRVMD